MFTMILAKESNRDVSSGVCGSEQLQRDHVTEHHQPVAPAMGAEKRLALFSLKANHSFIGSDRTRQ